jgi:hypothetical protein
MNDVGEFMLCKAAWKWVEKSIPIDTPLTNGLPYFSGDALFRILGSLPETGTLKLSNIDEELRDSYLKHMGEFAAGLISLDGYAYTPCSEPVYVVTGYGSVTVVEVQTEETLPEGSIAVFPLGACGEAVQFAAAISEQNGLRYGQILSDIYDSGDPIRTDYDARSLRQAAIVTARRFETLHTPYSPSQDDVRHLLNELPIEDIILYRSLKNIVKIIDLNDEISNRTFSLLEQALQSSTSSQLFTDRGLFPLKSVLDLWENRPVSIPGNVSVPKFR